MTLADGSPFSVKGLVGYGRAFGDFTPVSLLAFAAGCSQFSTAGTPIDRDAVIAEAGVDWRVTPDVTIGLFYAGQAGSRAQDSGVNGNLLYKFWTFEGVAFRAAPYRPMPRAKTAPTTRDAAWSVLV